MTHSELHDLLERYLTEEDLTRDERLRLQSVFHSEAQRSALEQYVDDFMAHLDKDHLLENPAMFKEMQEKLAVILDEPQTRQPARMPLIRRAWFRYAAVVIILVGVAAYMWTTNKKTDQTLVNSSNQLPADIGPGGERAVLTLADGTKIVLDSANNGNLVQQGNARIIKMDGQLVYNVNNISGKEVMWNTMHTPVGGQYQVSLPDGSKVWLNAASSITFPTEFTGKKREVKIQGEVYFEVAKNSRQPFVVDIAGTSLVEVLGTSFNINSYADEGSVKTTLVDGSIKVIKGDEKAILVPGQQAITAFAASPGQQLKLADNPDIEQTLAWKNGIFYFNGADLKTVMRQLKRWYGIEVKYEGDVTGYIFKGKMYRNVNLSDVLEMFKKMGVKIRMEGRTLTVL